MLLLCFLFAILLMPILFILLFLPLVQLQSGISYVNSCHFFVTDSQSYTVKMAELIELICGMVVTLN